MPKYKIRLVSKQYAHIIIEARNAAEALELAEEDDHETIVYSDDLDGDLIWSVDDEEPEVIDEEDD